MMSRQREEIGHRLRAYRLGRNISANEMARQINVSRAILYRLEKGELVKIDTLERVADVLGAPLASLMGVGVEYYRNAALFFERKRQLEENAIQIQGNFTPISFLLLSDEYIHHLRTMLLESQAVPNSHHAAFEEYVERVPAVLRERRDVAVRRRTPIVSVISSQSVERFLHSGLIGRYDLKPQVIRKRQMYAKREVERLVEFFRSSQSAFRSVWLRISHRTRRFKCSKTGILRPLRSALIASASIRIFPPASRS